MSSYSMTCLTSYLCYVLVSWNRLNRRRCFSLLFLFLAFPPFICDLCLCAISLLPVVIANPNLRLLMNTRPCSTLPVIQLRLAYIAWYHYAIPHGLICAAVYIELPTKRPRHANHSCVLQHIGACGYNRRNQ